MLRNTVLLCLLPLAAARATFGSIAAQTGCPKGYFLMGPDGGDKVCVTTKDEMSRDEALVACKKDGASLPTPDTEQMNSFFTGLGQGDIWLGFTCSSDPTKNQCCINDGADCNDHGSNDTSLGTCVYADNDGDWHNANCFFHIANTLCVYDPPPKYSGSCFNGYIHHGSSCYKYYSNPIAFKGAETACQYDKAQLTDIGSLEENSFVEELIFYSSGKNGTTTWIGLQRDANNATFFWTNWAAPVYTNFQTKPPASGSTECYALLPGGQWGPKPCALATADNASGYVCKRAPST